MKNKFLTIVMLVLMVSLALAACGNSITTNTDSSIPQHIHSFGSWETTLASCDLTTKIRFCGCGESQTVNDYTPTHSWLDATCEAPKTCSVCKKTDGEPLEHTWIEATCKTPKACSVCGTTEGAPLDHNWYDATCTSPKTCSQCGETEGNVGNHIDSGNGNCKYCKQDILLLNLQEGFDVKLIIPIVGDMNRSCSVKYTNLTEYAILLDYPFVYANGKAVQHNAGSCTLDSGYTASSTYFRSPFSYDMYLDNNSLAWTIVSINGKSIYVKFGVDGAVDFGYSAADIDEY